MKNKSLFFLIISTLLIGNLSAQNRNNRYAFTAKYNFIDNLTPLDGFSLFDKDNFSATTEGGEISLVRNINKFVNIGIPLRMGKAEVRREGIPDEFSRRLNISLDLVAQIGYFYKDYIVSPYIMGGVGYQLETPSSNNAHSIAFPVGAGLNIRLHPNVYLQAQTEYRFVSSENRDQIVYGVGLMFPLSRKKDEGNKDNDGDGIKNKDDECPEEPGKAKRNGCPDSDRDRIADKDDDCPDVKGLAKFGGCPDTDNDGVMDKEDECPDEVGTIELKGCPVQDADGDGVPDGEDECPAEAGTLANNGCPAKDADGDGVDDRDDRCPNEAGPLSNDGCPEVKDTDNDGINDEVDRCPNSPGPAANNGCPEIKVEDKEILNLAVSNVEFQSSRATLKTSSFVNLDQIVMLMNKYPDHHLSINGHTDSVGNSTTNQLLSERRAKSCYDYLVRKGIDSSRLDYVGYGESQPIADNRFKDGREKNRRVEFNLYLK